MFWRCVEFVVGLLRRVLEMLTMHSQEGVQHPSVDAHQDLRHAKELAEVLYAARRLGQELGDLFDDQPETTQQNT